MSVPTPDGIRLFARSYSPRVTSGPARTLVILHGTSEHGGRYEHVVSEVVRHGWHVVVPDQRGHGRSDGVPVHVQHFDRYLQDLDTLWQFFELVPERTAVLGHSFGGLVSIRFAQTRPNALASLIAVSPLLGLNVRIHPVTWMLGRFSSIVAPRTRFRSRVPVEATTRSRAALLNREADHLIHRSVTARWFFQMRKAIEQAWDESSRIHVPVLALQAGEDQIVDPFAVEPWLDAVAGDDCEFQMLEQHYHELLNEPDWRSTLTQIISWLESRTAVAAAAV